MARNLIDRKYYSLIWIALIFASLIANIYGIYLSSVEMQDVTRLQIIIAIFRAIVLDGGLSAAVCYVLALVMHAIATRRSSSAIPRNDFIYIVMIFTAISRLLCGIIEAFSIIEPRVYTFTSSLLNLVFLTLSYAVMFFVVFEKRYNLNPIEKYNYFRIWAMVYLVVLGISVVFQNSIYLVVFENPDLLALINETLSDLLGYTLIKDSLQTIASGLALAIYAVFVITAVILGEKMKKEANGYQAPETRGDYFDSHPNNPYTMRNDVGSTFSDFSQDPYKSKLDENPYRSDLDNDPYGSSGNSGNKDGNKNSGDGNVFDEFDI